MGVSIHLAPHFHYDVEWLKSADEYAERATRNVSDMLDIMDRDGKYKFALDQSYLFERFRERYPDCWDRLKARVQEGRVEIVGGMYCMPDLNIPSGESLVRQIEVGKRYFSENFGVDVKTGWMIDVFGHSAQTPQMMSKAGFDSYFFARGMGADGSTEFLWAAPDGSEIFAHWMSKHYSAGGPLPANRRAALWIIDRAVNEDKRPRPLQVSGDTAPLKGRALTENVFLPSGSDFTPPDPRTTGLMEKWNSEKDDLMVYSTPSEFVRAVRESFAAAGPGEMPRIEGELLSGRFNAVLPGTYSSRMGVKVRNRECECLLSDAEAYCAMEYALLAGAPSPPAAKLDEAWKALLVNQFHDVVCGSGVDRIYRSADARFDEAQASASSSINGSLERMVSRVDTRAEGGGKLVPVVVFNPLGWRVRGAIRVAVDPKDPAASFRVRDKEGAIIPSQSSYAADGASIIFSADVPSVGYSTYFLDECPGGRAEKACAPRNSAANDLELDTDFYRARIRRDNGMLELFDKRLGKLLEDVGELVIDNDVGDLYHHIPLRLPFAKGEFRERECEGAQVSVEEDGPVRTVVSVRNYRKGLGSVRWEKRITLYKDKPNVDFGLTLENRSAFKRVRARFPSAPGETFWSETQFGAIERGRRKDDVAGAEQVCDCYPVQNWADTSDGAGSCGFTVLNKGIPEHEVKPDGMYLTLLRSVGMLSWGDAALPLPAPGALERGSHEFSYSFVPHDGDWRSAKTYRDAYELNHALAVVVSDQHPGDLPKEGCALEIGCENSVISSFRRMDDGSLLLRLFETEGDSSAIDVKLAGTAVCEETDLLGKRLEPQNASSIRGFEIKTLRLTVPAETEK